MSVKTPLQAHERKYLQLGGTQFHNDLWVFRTSVLRTPREGRSSSRGWDEEAGDISDYQQSVIRGGSANLRRGTFLDLNLLTRRP